MSTAVDIVGDRTEGGIERLLRKAAEDPLVRKVVEEERRRKLKRRKRTAAMIEDYKPFPKEQSGFGFIKDSNYNNEYR